MSKGYLLVETTVLSIMASMMLAHLGWHAIPTLAALIALSLSSRDKPPTQSHLWVGGLVCGVALIGMIAGWARQSNDHQPFQVDPPQGFLTGKPPGVGRTPTTSAIFLAEVHENPTPTYTGWRTRAALKNDTATIYGDRKERPPLKGDLIVVRCKKQRDFRWGCALIDPGIVQRNKHNLKQRLVLLRFELIETFLAYENPRGARSAAALSSGAKSIISPIDRDQLARLGLLHLWAVSGLHVLLLALATSTTISWVWGRLFPGRARPAPYVVGAMGALPIVALYSSFVGSGPSAMRATTAFAVFAVLTASRHMATGRHLWIFTFALELAQTTEQLTSVGSLLSHAAVAGIIFALSNGDHSTKPKHPPWLSAMKSTFIAGVAATAATAPISATFFHSIAPMGMLLGILWVPLISVIVLPLCLVAVAGIALGFPAPVVTSLISAPTTILHFAWLTLDLVDSPLLRFSITPQWAPVMGPVAIFFLAAWPNGYIPRKTRKRFGQAFFILIALCAAANQSPRLHPTKGTQITALAVGKGDAYVVQLESGTTIMVDTGPGNPDGTSSAISPLRLRRLGIQQIDLLVITHRHRDHFGGGYRIAADIPISRCIRPKPGKGTISGDWLEFTQRLSNLDLECEAMSAGQSLRLPDYTLKVLFPTGDHATRPSTNENNDSMIAKITTRHGIIWVTGDSPKANESKLVGTSPTNFRGGVLLVPHHGSITSSSRKLLSHLSPEAAIVSHGKNIPVITHKKYQSHRIPICGTFPHGSVRLRLFQGFTLTPMDCLWEPTPQTPPTPPRLILSL